MELSRLYFEQLGEDTATTTISKPEAATPIAKEVYQCTDCLTIYDAEVEEGIDFQELPAAYTCSVCEADKNSFSPIQLISYQT